MRVKFNDPKSITYKIVLHIKCTLRYFFYYLSINFGCIEIATFIRLGSYTEYYQIPFILIKSDYEFNIIKMNLILIYYKCLINKNIHLVLKIM